jgi:hypothetical protein
MIINMTIIKLTTKQLTLFFFQIMLLNYVTRQLSHSINMNCHINLYDDFNKSYKTKCW